MLLRQALYLLSLKDLVFYGYCMLSAFQLPPFAFYRECILSTNQKNNIMGAIFGLIFIVVVVVIGLLDKPRSKKSAL
jgi:hypothetical protein